VRIIDLRKQFRTDQRLYAPLRSPHDDAVRKVLRLLGSERVTLPLPGDEEALRTPFERIWAHRIPDTNLVITYSVDLPTVVVHDVRPAWRAG
jgi:hypothetical protein